MNTKQIKKETMLSAYDRLDKLTILQFLKMLAKEVDARQLKLSSVNAGDNITITFDAEGNPKINAIVETSVEWDDILNKPLFKAIATSGDYNDIVTNKPSINANTLVGNKSSTDLGLIGDDNLLDKLEESISGTKFISVDYDETSEKIAINFDFTNIDEFIEYAEGQEVVASWTSDEKPKLKLNLKQELSNKINNSLQLPATHTEETLVGVDTAGAQEKIGIGEGLTIEAGKLKATGTGNKLYEHNILLSGKIVRSESENYNGIVSIRLITTSATQFTQESLVTFFTQKLTGGCTCSGGVMGVQIISAFHIIYDTAQTNYTLYCAGAVMPLVFNNITALQDNVRTIE